MQKITPHLWFDKEAQEAAEFYSTVFPDSKVVNVNTIHGTPSGDCDIVSFTVMGYSFMAISAGPYFKINPSISFMVNFDPSKDPEARTRLDEIWNKLSEGGKALMPLQKYDFSEYYGWIQDKYGVSWQLILTGPDGEERPNIVPSMLFAGKGTGDAEKATDFYISVFSAKGGSASGGKNSKRGTLAKYPDGAAPDAESKVMYTDFQLEGQWFAAMDGGHMHQFNFNEGVSLIVNCETQEEIDYYWEKMSAVPEAEQCGWIKDKYGVSWQITSTDMDKMMKEGTPEQVDRVTKAFLGMKKFDLAELQRAYEGK